MKLMGIDFETTGLDPKTCDITEAAWVMYDTEFGDGPIATKCFLNSDVKEIDPGAEEVTGISVERCKVYGISREKIATTFKEDIKNYKPDFVVAHNARQFDKIIFDRLLPENKMKWIDTMEDLPLETYNKLKTRTLEFMAARTGFLNPFPHAALADVMTMMKILMQENIEEVAEISTTPSVIISADVTFEKKDLAKTAGFSWQQIRGGKVYEKKWIYKLKKNNIEAVTKELPFDCSVLEELGF